MSIEFKIRLNMSSLFCKKSKKMATFVQEENMAIIYNKNHIDIKKIVKMSIKRAHKRG